MVWFPFMIESFLILLRVVFFQENVLRMHIEGKTPLIILLLQIGLVRMLILRENSDTVYTCSFAC
jgi:hypothetical protein